MEVKAGDSDTRDTLKLWEFHRHENVYDKFKPWLLELNQNPALCLGYFMHDSVERELLYSIAELLNYKQAKSSSWDEGWQKACALEQSW